MNLAREWAKYNIRVNAIRPGFFPTEWNKKILLPKKGRSNAKSYTYEKVWG